MITRKNTIKISIVIAVLTASGFLVQSTDLRLVIYSVHQIGFRFIFLLLLTFIAYLLASIGWKYCFRNNARALSFMDLFFIRHIGEMVSLINPAGIIGGEAMKIYMLQNKGIDKADMVSSVLISRVMMAVTQVFIFIVSLGIIFSSNAGIFRFLPHFRPEPAWIFLLILTLILIFSCRNYLVRALEKTKFYNSVKLSFSKWQLKQAFVTFSNFFRNDLESLVCCAFFFSLHWIIGSLEIYFILLFTGIKAGIFQVLLVDMGIVLFKAAGAFVPGQIGVEEIGNKIMLQWIGIPDHDIWITVSILRRSRQIFWIAFGFAAYFIYTRKVGNLPDLS